MSLNVEVKHNQKLIKVSKVSRRSEIQQRVRHLTRHVRETWLLDFKSVLRGGWVGEDATQPDVKAVLEW